MANAFFRLRDNRRAYSSYDIRLSEVVAVGDPKSVQNDWYVNVAMRDGSVYQIGSADIISVGKQRDELMHALEQDAKRERPEYTHPLDRPAETQDRRTTYGHGDD